MKAKGKPKSYITEKGYRRIYIPAIKKRKYAHILVWEKHNGPIPKGYEIHHINYDRLDNRIKNLSCMPQIEHSRLHSRSSKNDKGVWVRICKVCKVTKYLNKVFYNYSNKGYFSSMCRSCNKEYMKQYRINKKADLKCRMLT